MLYWFKVKNVEISQIDLNIEYMIIYIFEYDIFLVEIMISYIWLWIIWLWINSDTQPMRVIHWYSDTQPMRVIYWYSDTRTNGGYLLALWHPNQWRLFIGTLMPSHGNIARDGTGIHTWGGGRPKLKTKKKKKLWN